MSKSAASGRAKRNRSMDETTIAKTTSERARTGTPPISNDQRHAMIAESAYLRAAARGFSGGDPVSDWLESEREVDRLLSASRS